MRMKLAEAAKCLGIAGENRLDAEFSGACVDSRQVAAGNLFVCVKGDRVDGHDFARQAVENGAAAILAGHPLPNVDIPVLKVEDTAKALGSLARACRDKMAAEVICITGTAGKTTLKDTLASIFAQAGKVYRTPGNHNNQIGLPLTILNAPEDIQFLILEAGISHAGDMEYLGAIARPDLAIILNVGPGHTEGLGQKGVAWHKTRLLKYLSRDGKALICGDYPDLTQETDKLGLPFLQFSARDQAGANFAVIGGKPEEGIYRLRLGSVEEDFATQFLGLGGAETAIAAAAAASICGLDIAAIRKGFACAKISPQRFNLFKVGGWHIFDDTYNANPLSMQRMLEAAASYARERHRPFFAVLGEMGELGNFARDMHFHIGKILGGLSPRQIFWKGNFGEAVLRGIEAAGGKSDFTGLENREDFKKYLPLKLEDELADQKGVIIFKGSRMNRLEELLEDFTDMLGGAPHVL